MVAITAQAASLETAPFANTRRRLTANPNGMTNDQVVAACDGDVVLAATTYCAPCNSLGQPIIDTCVFEACVHNVMAPQTGHPHAGCTGDACLVGSRDFRDGCVTQRMHASPNTMSAAYPFTTLREDICLEINYRYDPVAISCESGHDVGLDGYSYYGRGWCTDTGGFNNGISHTTSGTSAQYLYQYYDVYPIASDVDCKNICDANVGCHSFFTRNPEAARNVPLTTCYLDVDPGVTLTNFLGHGPMNPHAPGTPGHGGSTTNVPGVRYRPIHNLSRFGTSVWPVTNVVSYDEFTNGCWVKDAYVPITPNPTANPTATPTANPTATPTATPTANPTAVPTADPTPAPTQCDHGVGVHGCCPAVIPAASRGSTCASTGDPHITQFDGNVNHAYVTGDYLLYAGAELLVATRHLNNHPSVAGNNAVYMMGNLLGGNSIQFFAKTTNGNRRIQNTIYWNGASSSFDQVCANLVGIVCRCVHSAGDNRLSLIFDEFNKVVLQVFDTHYGYMNVHVNIDATQQNHPTDSGMCTAVGSHLHDPLVDPYPTFRYTCANDPFIEDRATFCARRRIEEPILRRLVPTGNPLDTCGRSGTGFASAADRTAAMQFCVPCDLVSPGRFEGCMLDVCNGGMAVAQGEIDGCIQTRIDAADPADRSRFCPSGQVYNALSHSCGAPITIPGPVDGAAPAGTAASPVAQPAPSSGPITLISDAWQKSVVWVVVSAFVFAFAMFATGICLGMRLFGKPSKIPSKDVFDVEKQQPKTGLTPMGAGKLAPKQFISMTPKKHSSIELLENSLR